ncbi:MAG: type 1 glutamine amidotransferase [Verrucomicrobiota bacterium]
MTTLRFLIIDGYTAAARQQLVDGGASMAGDLYKGMLARWSPGEVETDVLFPADGVSLPDVAALARYDGVTWTGCSLGCNDGTEEVNRQIELQQGVFQCGVPSFGSCWAAQIAVVAAGGRVAVNPNGREMGLARKIVLTPEGLGHPLHRGRNQVYDAFTSHDDEITHLPPGAVVLSGNAFTRVQSVAVTHGNGEFWGVQSHPEYDLHELARLTYCRIEKLVGRGFFKDAAAAERYIADLEALHVDPSRKDLAWKLGIDADVMDETVRCKEVRNWIEQLVIPRKQRA